MAKIRRRLSISATLKVYIIGAIAPIFLWILFKTIRWKRNDLSNFDFSSPVIVAFWHGRQLMLAPLFSGIKNSTVKSNPKMLISDHSDGRIIAMAIRFFGISTIHGSSSRGGAEALFQLKEAIQQDKCTVAITPDGPRGPAFNIKPGVIKLASITGAPIIPIAYGTSTYISLSSWDKMILPKPFSTGVCILGDPINVPRDLTEDQTQKFKQIIKEAINNVTNICDGSF